MGTILLLAAAGVFVGGVCALALARWRHAFPALFLAGVGVFLAWNAVELWRDESSTTLGMLAGFFALLGWIAGVMAALTARRGRTALRTYVPRRS
jgi:hypothetical protein